MKKILITGIGGDVAQSAATIIKECFSDIHLIGVDMHAQHGGHLYVDEFFIVPTATDANYLDVLRSIVCDYQVDAVIPMSEPELKACLPFLEIAPDIKWITAGNNVVEVGLDKLRTMESLKEIGLPVPWTQIVQHGDPSEYPCILKSRIGSGSRHVHVIHNKRDVDYFKKSCSDWIFQQLLEPANREVTCAVYRRRNGDVSVLLMLRRLVGGSTSWAKVIYDPDAVRMCELIANHLDLKGSMNIQMRLTPEGPRIFEINPRFSSTVLMRHRLGFSDLLWAIKEAKGITIEFPNVPIGKIAVRVQGATSYF